MPQPPNTWNRDSPGETRHRTIEFLIDEIADPSKSKTERCRNHDGIRQPQQIDFTLTESEEKSDRNTEESAMRRHAPLPHREYLHWMREKIHRLVKENETQPPPHDDAKNGESEKSFPFLSYECKATVPLETRKQPPCEKKSSKIEHAIPADRESEECDGNGARREKGNHLS
ncbi:hypothetical protein A3H22_00285 [Candidatus Peribacteria bacterium RIFCSPLOWO2_12_FULL_55_15]|nr:MAG: hypothetical protein A2789_02390 [Candidatus Peribacteria bacterium RIFCSPHIGHO2_01_FULL_54_22]OGJ63352.1 MAG: hypothetical protein A3D12_00265 [Candidatus Peribacteria bacterium RIFCSPHIGHO2_02_FULL_55_24]OGJ64629.1 MAG: hypothetical protein A3E47_01870 [Candidatus Peribacteria bacterium RIFCSPHIGHO2_12_FULL_54_10]OGJ68235.1 MAG: hypothetical protein A2947_01955 [Candidatus Peribacteria bacterium RIFCSPLOWO2_01_FULL_54_110]OGJ70332.1 MAG: hypothetical protein A3H22_00285 [Candidatus Pe